MITNFRSGGSLKLASSDPFAKPLIDPNFLTTTFDIFALRETVKAVKRFVASSAWADYVVGPVGGLASTTDSDIETYIREQASTGLHPVGTASMSPKGAQWGVVDPDLKVKGVEGVRVVDASVFVSVPWCESRLSPLDCSLVMTAFRSKRPPPRTNIFVGGKSCGTFREQYVNWTFLFNCLPVDIWLKSAFIELALLFNTEKS